MAGVSRADKNRLKTQALARLFLNMSLNPHKILYFCERLTKAKGETRRISGA